MSAKIDRDQTRLELEIKCFTCEGSGYLGNDRCFECSGHGTLLTEFGEQIIGLIGRRFKLDRC